MLHVWTNNRRNTRPLSAAKAYWCPAARQVYIARAPPPAAAATAAHHSTGAIAAAAQLLRQPAGWGDVMDVCRLIRPSPPPFLLLEHIRRLKRWQPWGLSWGRQQQRRQTRLYMPGRACKPRPMGHPAAARTQDDSSSSMGLSDLLFCPIPSVVSPHNQGGVLAVWWWCPHSSVWCGLNVTSPAGRHTCARINTSARTHKSAAHTSNASSAPQLSAFHATLWVTSSPHLCCVQAPLDRRLSCCCFLAHCLRALGQLAI